MKFKTKTIGKITAGILVVGTTFFGLLTSSITLPQSDSINNSNLTTYKINKEDDAAINTLKSKGTITQTSMSYLTSSALVLDDKGKTHLYMWGDNGSGQQGNGIIGGIVTTPKEVTNFNNLPKGWKITKISMSMNTSSALVKDKDNKTHLYMWGDNGSGQQGDETNNNVTIPKEVTKLNKFLNDENKITQISMSESTSSVLVQGLDNKTHLYMWGANDCGQQGNKSPQDITTPTKVKLPSNLTITQISMSGFTSSALVQDSDKITHLYMWGANNYGQQGDGKTDDVTTPTEVTNLNQFLPIGTTITQISMSMYTSSALVKDKDNKTHLYMWGINSSGQQGDTTLNNVNTPTKVKLPSNLIITKISISYLTSSALVQDKNGKTHLYMWGDNGWGQQGDGTNNNVTTPKEVAKLKDLPNEGKITQISMSGWTSSALVKDKNGKTTHLYMWGDNDYAQQGNGIIGGIVTTLTKVLESPTTHNNRNYVWIYCVSIGTPVFALILFGIYKFKNPSKNKNKPLSK